jgi:cytochrome c peroxidase
VQTGADGVSKGKRAVPSLRYLQSVPEFTEEFVSDKEPNATPGPAGGHTWDGRARAIHLQAKLPLLAPNEMANKSSADVVTRVRNAGYADLMRTLIGTRAQNDDDTFLLILLALEAYQREPAEFFPFTSKFDAYLRGQVKLTPEEMSGMALYNAEHKGNCAACHPNERYKGEHPVFSDWAFEAIGVPRNNDIPANKNARQFDLGLCGPERKDLQYRISYCGKFRTPTLRNVSTRKVFFHNGIIKSLEDAVAFYATRDTQPERWYPRNAKTGAVTIYNDLPKRFHGNINREPPFNRKRGDEPALTEEEIREIVLFLKTLEDGYVVPTATSAAPSSDAVKK